jgi:alpha-methylacyl-CoA racemase
VQPLAGVLVADLTRYLPGPFASRELLRLGARVVRLEPPDGDPLRTIAPGWDAALNGGKESVVCDLKLEPDFGRALCARADIVLEGFRPGVADRLGVGPDDLPEHVVYCSITGFGSDGRHARRAGHDLNYLGWAGTLADTAPALPPVPVADLAAGGLMAVIEILAALLERRRTARGQRLVVSMTHGAHRLADYRLGGDPQPRLLTGGVACYGVYATADGRYLTLAALEPGFWRRFCEVLGRDDLIDHQWAPDLPVLRELLASRPLGEWLDLFELEDACVAPVATLAEASAEFAGQPPSAPAPQLGEHTELWRRDLGL